MSADAANGRWKTVGLYTLYTVLALALAGGIVVIVAFLIKVNPGADPRAANWISGVSAVVSGLNVVLTFYLLMTALGQLKIVRKDLEDQQVRHEEQIREQEERRRLEADQARADLEHMQGLLAGMNNSLQLARTDAQRSQQETAMSRFDLVAPRCSIEPENATVSVYTAGPNVSKATVSDKRQINRSEIVPDHMAEVSFFFGIKNWGDEPVFISLDGTLSPSGSFVLYPNGAFHSNENASVNQFQYKATHSILDWIRIVKGEIDIHGQPLPEGHGAKAVEITAVVTSIGREVTDTHTWRMVVSPIEVHEFHVIAQPGQDLLKGASKMAVRKRQYHSVPMIEGSTGV